MRAEVKRVELENPGQIRINPGDGQSKSLTDFTHEKAFKLIRKSRRFIASIILLITLNQVKL
jgi:hypothetical protein